MTELTNVRTNVEVIDPVSKCCSSDCHAVAAFVVYWPGQTKNMCAKCCGRATNIAVHMGFDLPSKPIPPRHIVSLSESPPSIRVTLGGTTNPNEAARGGSST